MIKAVRKHQRGAPLQDRWRHLSSDKNGYDTWSLRDSSY
jgi:hypothetical protein